MNTNDLWQARATEVLRPHLGHIALIQGWHEVHIDEQRLEPEAMTVMFAGFAVHCETCGVSLSQQWNE